MSWMRMVSIASFKKYNPTWEIRLHDTPADIRSHGLMYGQEADWTWWRMLEAYGGFAVASDIVFVRPVPDEWLDCGINGCVNNSRGIYQNAMVGAVPWHPYITHVVVHCDSMAKLRPTGYQDFGVNLLQRIGKKELDDLYDQPMDALCYFKHTEVDALWSDEHFDLPDSTIGIHWYGGHIRSKAEEPEAMPGDTEYIVRLATSAFDNPVCNPHFQVEPQ